MAQPDLFHDTVNCTSTGYVDIFWLLQEQRLVHTNLPAGVIIFILRADFQHGVRQGLVLPGSISTSQILIKTLSADLQYPAIKSDFSDDLAVRILSFLLTSDGSLRKKRLPPPDIHSLL